MKSTQLLMCAALVLVGCSGADKDSASRGGGGGNNPAGDGDGDSAGATAGDFNNGAGSGVGPGAGSGGMGPGMGPGPTGPTAIDDCPGEIDPALVDQLQAGGVETVAPMRWLYPYDRTVFPRGLESPLLQWDETEGGTEAVYLHLSSTNFDYKGCLPPTAPGQLQIPQAAWEAATAQSSGAGDPLNVELVTAGGGTISALPARSWIIALASLKGAIYYNTYDSAIASGQGAPAGVVMRILPGQAEPEVFLTAQNTVLNCIGCHSVSADGSRMVAEEHGALGLAYVASSAFDLAGAVLKPMPAATGLDKVGFSGLYPDGSVYVTTGRPQPGPLGGTGNVPGTFGPQDTALYDGTTGQIVDSTGLPKYTLMPTFSTDGKKLVFTEIDDTGVGGKGLAILDFDRATNTFSNPETLFTDPTQFVGWPFFLPHTEGSDSRAVVFALGTNGDFSTQDAPVGLLPHASDLWWIDVNTKMAARLERAGGFEGGASYLPFAERDEHLDFMPTVSPVAAGGYVWLFFTSRRHYGNRWQQGELKPTAKKIWVSAIDINAEPGTDPSHPAFLLPGQEFDSGNIRAFSALEPCLADGESCETGLDCCTGFCIDGTCGMPEVPRCSTVDEKCETAADCCDTEGTLCVGGFCGFVLE